MESRGRKEGCVSNCRLYLVTPPRLELRAFADQLKRAIDGGDIASLQLRLKDVDDDAIRQAVDVLRPIAQRANIAFILNDRPDLASEVDCDGVHVGQEDMPYTEARALMGKDAIVGVTCHDSRHLAIEAAEAGADYVAFGAFYPTKTKEPKTSADIELLKWWSEYMVVPCVAIGGITVANAKPLIEAGADFLAVAGGVWDHARGPTEAVREFNRLMK
jgi:thiamine-phosphate pyrophosphorylase